MNTSHNVALTQTIGFTVAFFLAALGVALLFVAPVISDLERAAGYPFGQMCDIDRSCPRGGADR